MTGFKRNEVINEQTNVLVLMTEGPVHRWHLNKTKCKLQRNVNLSLCVIDHLCRSKGLSIDACIVLNAQPAYAKVIPVLLMLGSRPSRHLTVCRNHDGSS